MAAARSNTASQLGREWTETAAVSCSGRCTAAQPACSGVGGTREAAVTAVLVHSRAASQLGGEWDDRSGSELPASSDVSGARTVTMSCGDRCPQQCSSQLGCELDGRKERQWFAVAAAHSSAASQLVREWKPQGVFKAAQQASLGVGGTKSGNCVVVAVAHSSTASKLVRQ